MPAPICKLPWLLPAVIWAPMPNPAPPDPGWWFGGFSEPPAVKEPLAGPAVNCAEIPTGPTGLWIGLWIGLWMLAATFPCGASAVPLSCDKRSLSFDSLSKIRQPLGKYKSFHCVNLPFLSIEFSSSSSEADLWDGIRMGIRLINYSRCRLACHYFGSALIG